MSSFIVEYAKSGRAGCKKCKEKIAQGTVRIGSERPSYFHDGMDVSWHHPKCLPKKPTYVSSVKGLDSLRAEDKNRIFALCGDGHNYSGNSLLSTDDTPTSTSNIAKSNQTSKSTVQIKTQTSTINKDAQKTLLYDIPVQLLTPLTQVAGSTPSIGYAASNNSRCRTCLTNINKDTLRMGYIDDQAENVWDSISYQHPTCFFRSCFNSINFTTMFQVISESSTMTSTVRHITDVSIADVYGTIYPNPLPGSLTTFEGFNTISPTDQLHIRQLWSKSVLIHVIKILCHNSSSPFSTATPLTSSSLFLEQSHFPLLLSTLLQDDATASSISMTQTTNQKHAEIKSQLVPKIHHPAIHTFISHMQQLFSTPPPFVNTFTSEVETKSTKSYPLFTFAQNLTKKKQLLMDFCNQARGRSTSASFITPLSTTTAEYYMVEQVLTRFNDIYTALGEDALINGARKGFDTSQTHSSFIITLLSLVYEPQLTPLATNDQYKPLSTDYLSPASTTIVLDYAQISHEPLFHHISRLVLPLLKQFKIGYLDTLGNSFSVPSLNIFHPNFISWLQTNTGLHTSTTSTLQELAKGSFHTVSSKIANHPTISGVDGTVQSDSKSSTTQTQGIIMPCHNDPRYINMYSSVGNNQSIEKQERKTKKNTAVKRIPTKKPARRSRIVSSSSSSSSSDSSSDSDNDTNETSNLKCSISSNFISYNSSLRLNSASNNVIRDISQPSPDSIEGKVCYAIFNEIRGLRLLSTYFNTIAIQYTAGAVNITNSDMINSNPIQIANTTPINLMSLLDQLHFSKNKHDLDQSGTDDPAIMTKSAQNSPFLHTFTSYAALHNNNTLSSLSSTASSPSSSSTTSPITQKKSTNGTFFTPLISPHFFPFAFPIFTSLRHIIHDETVSTYNFDTDEFYQNLFIRHQYYHTLKLSLSKRTAEKTKSTVSNASSNESTDLLNKNNTDNDLSSQITSKIPPETLFAIGGIPSMQVLDEIYATASLILKNSQNSQNSQQSAQNSNKNQPTSTFTPHQINDFFTSLYTEIQQHFIDGICHKVYKAMPITKNMFTKDHCYGLCALNSLMIPHKTKFVTQQQIAMHGLRLLIRGYSHECEICHQRGSMIFDSKSGLFACQGTYFEDSDQSTPCYNVTNEPIFLPVSFKVPDIIDFKDKQTHVNALELGFSSKKKFQEFLQQWSGVFQQEVFTTHLDGILQWVKTLIQNKGLDKINFNCSELTTPRAKEIFSKHVNKRSTDGPLYLLPYPYSALKSLTQEKTEILTIQEARTQQLRERRASTNNSSVQRSTSRSSTNRNGNNFEDEENKKKIVVVKGRAIVSDKFDHANIYHVYDPGDITPVGQRTLKRQYDSSIDPYSAMLSAVSSQKCTNSFYSLQLLELDSTSSSRGRSTYIVFREWGRLGGDRDNNTSDGFNDLEDAIAFFLHHFEEKSGNIWGQKPYQYSRLHFFPVDIQLLNDDDSNDDTFEGGHDTNDTNGSVLPLPLYSLIKRIFDSKGMEIELKQMELDITNAPLGQLSLNRITQGRNVLQQLAEVLIDSYHNSGYDVDAQKAAILRVKQSLDIVADQNESNDKNHDSMTPTGSNDIQMNDGIAIPSSYDSMAPAGSNEAQMNDDIAPSSPLDNKSGDNIDKLQQRLPLDPTIIPPVLALIDKQRIFHLTDKFYTLIPHVLDPKIKIVADPFTQSYILNSLSKIKIENDLLDTLQNIYNTQQLRHTASDITHTLQATSKATTREIAQEINQDGQQLVQLGRTDLSCTTHGNNDQHFKTDQAGHKILSTRQLTTELHNQRTRYYSLIDEMAKDSHSINDTFSISPTSSPSSLNANSSTTDYKAFIDAILFSKHPIDRLYLSLKNFILPMNRKSTQFQILQQYVNQTHGASHSGYHLYLENVFAVHRFGEQDRYHEFLDVLRSQLYEQIKQPISTLPSPSLSTTSTSFERKTRSSAQQIAQKRSLTTFQTHLSNNDISSEELFTIERDLNRRLLFHGSRTANIASILSTGLLLNPDAVITGKMFGESVYLASSSSKSANYCNVTPSINANDGIGFLFLHEAALGHPKRLIGPEHITNDSLSKKTNFINGKKVQVNSIEGVGMNANRCLCMQSYCYYCTHRHPELLDPQSLQTPTSPSHTISPSTALNNTHTTNTNDKLHHYIHLPPSSTHITSHVNSQNLTTTMTSPSSIPSLNTNNFLCVPITPLEDITLTPEYQSLNVPTPRQRSLQSTTQLSLNTASPRGNNSGLLAKLDHPYHHALLDMAQDEYNRQYDAIFNKYYVKPMFKLDTLKIANKISQTDFDSEAKLVTSYFTTLQDKIDKNEIIDTIFKQHGGKKAGSLLYNEYMVYNEAQVCMRYLLQVKFLPNNVSNEQYEQSLSMIASENTSVVRTPSTINTHNASRTPVKTKRSLMGSDSSSSDSSSSDSSDSSSSNSDTDSSFADDSD